VYKTGNVFTAHADPRLLAFDFMQRVQPAIRTETGFSGLAPPCGHRGPLYGIVYVCSPGHKGHDDLNVIPALPPVCHRHHLRVPSSTCWQLRSRVALVADLTQHLTTRADETMHHLSPLSPKRLHCLQCIQGDSRPGKVLALLRIKPHTPLLVRSPSIPLSFSLATVLPGECLSVNFGTQGIETPDT